MGGGGARAGNLWFDDFGRMTSFLIVDYVPSNEKVQKPKNTKKLRKKLYFVGENR